MEGTSLRAALEREPVDARGVEPMHGRPAIEPLADIGRHALLARDSDEDRNEAMIAMSVDRRSEPDARCPYAARHQRGCSFFRFAGKGGRLGWRILLGRRAA